MSRTDPSYDWDRYLRTQEPRGGTEKEQPHPDCVPFEFEGRDWCEVCGRDLGTASSNR